MNSSPRLQTTANKPLQSAGASLFLQRKCACGGAASGLTGECEECSNKKIVGLQTKLQINEPGDVYEQEADRVAEQVLAKPAGPNLSGAPPRIQRLSRSSRGQISAAPASVDRVLANPGRPLEPALRRDMEQRFGHDFSRVRVHTDAAAAASARHIDAHAYTAGTDMVFATDRFAPGTNQGRRLLAHELTHVVQQTSDAGRSARRAGIVQREESEFSPIPEPKDLIWAHYFEMKADNFDGIVARLLLVLAVHSNPAAYLQDFFEAANENISQWEDNIAAELVRHLTEDRLDALASTYHGRYALSLMYVAMITGSVSDFERAQANRVLFAKARQYSPDDFARRSRYRGKDIPTRVFPVRFMRVTGGDYAPPLAELLPTGMVRVSYPQRVAYMDTFKKELRTIGNFIGGDGDEISANEIVIIKDYERGTETPLPALALVDYSNQAIHSTMGKIVEVSIFAATLGFGGGAVASAEAGEAAAVRFTATAIWGARIAKAVRVLDVAANVIGVAAFVIDENRQWIIKKLGPAGEWLVRISDVANAAVAIYGLGRLAHSGFKLAKDFHAAASKARANAKDLTNAEASIIEEVDDKMAQLSREIDEATTESSKAKSTKLESEVGTHGDDRVSPPKASTEVPAKPTRKAASDLDEIHASASAHKIPPHELEHEVGDLRRQTADPDKVQAPPKDANLDAEMNARGHEFDRNKKKRTWCRHSDDACDLELGAKLNSDVDDALAKKRKAKVEETERQRKVETPSHAKPEPAKNTPDKSAKHRREQEELRSQAREDREFEEHVGDTEQHGVREKTRRQRRNEERAQARETERKLQAESSREAMKLYEDARAGKFTHLSDENKRKLVEKFERLMENAGWSPQKRNPMKGNFDEWSRTKKGATAQPEYLAGGPRVAEQGKRGTARPDFDEYRSGPQGAPKRAHINLKADNLHLMTEAEAVAVARKYTKKAAVNARALPANEPIVLRYGARPIDEFGESVALEKAMNAVHFEPGSHVSEVHYGTVAYRNPNMFGATSP
jgi:hypothetical protein